MAFSLVILYLLLSLLTDLTAASLYALTDWPGVDGLRLGRDLLAFGLFVHGFLSAPFPRGLRLLCILYGGLVGLYVVAGVVQEEPVRLVVGAAAKLLLPVVLMFAGASGIGSLAAFRRYSLVFVALGAASAAFGFWDVRHTDFWTESVAYGDYLYDIKNISAGFQPEYMLPWNYFGFDDSRRAAGLVASPLAQGAILAYAACLGFALARTKSGLVAGALLVFFLYGILLSGTRGALLTALIALPIFIVLSSQRLNHFARDMIILLFLAGLIGEAVLFILDYTTTLSDGSTVGHVIALQNNLLSLGRVLVAGLGLTQAGSIAYDQGDLDAVGVEGAFFAVTYQVGLAGGVLFLAIYVWSTVVLMRGRTVAALRSAAAAVAALLIGSAPTLVISETVLAVSGAAPLWLAVGGMIRLVHVAGATEPMHVAGAAASREVP